MVFNEDGTAEFLYDDNVAEVAREVGELTISRASHVEPLGDGWVTDLSPVGGATFGPFRKRQDALDFEVGWLKRNRGL